MHCNEIPKLVDLTELCGFTQSVSWHKQRITIPSPCWVNFAAEVEDVKL
jgi:hypothetical protein